MDGKLKITVQDTSEEWEIIFMEKEFFVNKSLIWDYDFKGNYDTLEFKKWYIARVLSYGRMDDLRQIGLKTIKDYFPQLNLPLRIRKFWEWYFQHAYSH